MRLIIGQMIALILSIAVHEYGHAIVADKLGDGLPRSEGRVTLNPIAHMDPIGTLAFPLIGLLATGGMTFGFGWGRPVRVNPPAFTRKMRMRTSHMLVAAAGPAMNVLLGLTITVVLVLLIKFRVLPFPGGSAHNPNLSFMIYQAAGLNFFLAFFNLIPTPPLDGGAVLQGFLPDRLQPAFEEYSKYGIFILFAIILIPTLGEIFFWPALQVFHGWFHLVAGWLL